LFRHPPQTVRDLWQSEGAKSTALLVLSLLGLAVQLIALLLVHFQSALPFLFSLAITLGIYAIVFRDNLLEPLGLFVFYSTIIIVLCFAHYLTLPEYYGFSGGFGVGTDDSHFYTLVADRLPNDFPIRLGYWLRDAPYAVFLRAINPFPVTHPLDVLFFNAIPAAFVPIFTRRLTLEITGDPPVARLAFILTALGPILMMNGLILIRDGWTAALFTGTILFFVQHRHVPTFLAATLLFFLRIASGLQLLIALFCFGTLAYGSRGNTTKRIISFVVIALGATAVLSIAYPFILQYVTEERIFENPFFRGSFVEEFLTLQQGRNQAIVAISQQSALIRAPLSFAYFLANPFFVPQTIWNQGFIIPRAVLGLGFAFAFLVFFLKNFVQGVIEAVKRGNPGIRIVALVFCILLLLVAQVSLQVRHKTMIMPLMYILVAYGYYHGSKGARQIGAICAGSFALITALNLIRLV
jgi:hypothetical protein